MGKKTHFIWITQQVRKRDYRKQRVGESEADLCLWTKDNTLDNKMILTVQSNLLCTKLTTFTFRVFGLKLLEHREIMRFTIQSYLKNNNSRKVLGRHRNPDK